VKDVFITGEKNVSLVIKSDTKNLLNKMVSQFSRSGYDERWANLEITFRDNKLYLYGGGQGILIVVMPDIEGTERDFAGQVDLRRFFEAIKFMGKDVVLEFNSDVILRKNSRVVNLKVHNNTFDPMLPIPIDDVFNLKGTKMELIDEDFKSLYEFLIVDDLRPGLECIYTSSDKGKTYYTATDAHHLIEIRTKMTDVEPFLIDKSIPFPFGGEKVYVRKVKNHIIYNSSNWITYQNIINNNVYPEYRKVLDQLYGEWKTFTVNRRDMIYALRAAMAFAGGKTTAAITFKLDGEVLSMTSRNKFNLELDVYNDKIKIGNFDKLDLEVTFFTKYFLDGIVASGDEEVSLNVASNGYIFISENDRRILLLPIKN